MKNAVLVGISCTLFTLVTHAQWELIDDFDQWEASAVFTEATDIGWHATDKLGTDEYWMLANPQDPENTSLWVEPGSYGVPPLPLFVMKDLPSGGIAPDESGVLFFRSYWAGDYNGWSMGTADKELEFDDVTGLQTVPGEWDDFNALINVASPTTIGGVNRILRHRDRDQYVLTNPEVIIEDYKWYSFWMYIENTWDYTVAPPVSTGGFKLYLQGPDDAEPRLIPVGTDPPKDLAFFRRAPVDAEGNPDTIRWVMFSTSPLGIPASTGSPTLLDDFYFIKLNNWGYIPWLRDPTVVYGDVDTGDLLGWINVDHNPFIYSYSVGWMYIPDLNLDAPGLWVYFYK